MRVRAVVPSAEPSYLLLLQCNICVGVQAAASIGGRLFTKRQDFNAAYVCVSLHPLLLPNYISQTARDLKQETFPPPPHLRTPPSHLPHPLLHPPPLCSASLPPTILCPIITPQFFAVTMATAVLVRRSLCHSRWSTVSRRPKPRITL